MMILTIGGLAAAAMSLQTGVQPTPDRAWLGQVRRSKMEMRASDGGTPVANLPHANGRAFATLDAYLAHLRDHAAPMDLPWYREVRPGVFRRETNLRTGAAPQEFTRAQLERLFHFAK